MKIPNLVVIGEAVIKFNRQSTKTTIFNSVKTKQDHLTILLIYPLLWFNLFNDLKCFTLNVNINESKIISFKSDLILIFANGETKMYVVIVVIYRTSKCDHDSRWKLKCSRYVSNKKKSKSSIDKHFCNYDNSFQLQNALIIFNVIRIQHSTKFSNIQGKSIPFVKTLMANITHQDEKY